ncbi:MAG: hypothetical protein ACHQUB_01120 [Candidatus Saccharimonadia bacterium]
MKDRYLQGAQILNHRTFQPKRLGDAINWRLLALRAVVIMGLLLGIGGFFLLLAQMIHLIFAPVDVQPNFHKLIAPIVYIALAFYATDVASNKIRSARKRSN